ncbi:hypothetical protein AB3X52_01690 [Nocardioides sp. DS6]|uniref:TetR/AcrR family transcriptional regulator n=1 Tax=Nocardioides eburneus TaxID=3231482 RepID=A0ABV3SX94_9ACTN
MDLSKLANPDHPSDFAEPTSVDHAAMYADAVVTLLADGGFEQVAMGPVARWLEQVPSAVKQRAGGREGFLRMVVGRFARRWLRWATFVPYRAAVPLRLPAEDDEVHGVRVWAVLREIAYGEARAGRPGLAELVREAEQRERDSMGRAFSQAGRPLTEIELGAVSCLVAGLRAALVRPVDPLPLHLADEIVAMVVGWLHLPPSD